MPTTVSLQNHSYTTFVQRLAILRDVVARHTLGVLWVGNRLHMFIRTRFY
jgi:hypothetical protein